VSGELAHSLVASMIFNGPITQVLDYPANALAGGRGISIRGCQQAGFADFQRL
jgi:hypothetical protein